jgi:hypothetical protein
LIRYCNVKMPLSSSTVAHVRGRESWAKKKANNTAGLLVVRFFTVFSQSAYIIISSSTLIHDSLVSLTDFLGSCTQADPLLFSLLSSLLSPPPQHLASLQPLIILALSRYKWSNRTGGVGELGPCGKASRAVLE